MRVRLRRCFHRSVRRDLDAFSSTVPRRWMLVLRRLAVGMLRTSRARVDLIASFTATTTILLATRCCHCLIVSIPHLGLSTRLILRFFFFLSISCMVVGSIFFLGLISIGLDNFDLEGARLDILPCFVMDRLIWRAWNLYIVLWYGSYRLA